MILHLVTDRHRLAPRQPIARAIACLQQQARYAVDAGVDIIQIRERDLSARELFAVTESIVRSVQGTHTRVVVNDRLDVALSAGAHGVHLPASAMGVAEARRLAPSSFLVGRSLHSADQLQASAGADYVIAGTVFPTSSKPHLSEWLGLDGLAHLVRQASVPVIAIGGVTLERLPDVAMTGAAGVAAIGLFMDAAGHHAGPDADRLGCGATELSAVTRAARLVDTPRSGS